MEAPWTGILVVPYMGFWGTLSPTAYEIGVLRWLLTEGLKSIDKNFSFNHCASTLGAPCFLQWGKTPAGTWSRVTSMLGAGTFSSSRFLSYTGPASNCWKWSLFSCCPGEPTGWAQVSGTHPMSPCVMSCRQLLPQVSSPKSSSSHPSPCHFVVRVEWLCCGPPPRTSRRGEHPHVSSHRPLRGVILETWVEGRPLVPHTLP